jgi:hypothetical protein
METSGTDVYRGGFPELHDASSGEYADQSGPGSELDAVDHASTVGTIRRFERFEAAFRKEDVRTKYTSSKSARSRARFTNAATAPANEMRLQHTRRVHSLEGHAARSAMISGFNVQTGVNIRAQYYFAGLDEGVAQTVMDGSPKSSSTGELVGTRLE